MCDFIATRPSPLHRMRSVFITSCWTCQCWCGRCAKGTQVTGLLKSIYCVWKRKGKWVKLINIQCKAYFIAERSFQVTQVQKSVTVSLKSLNFFKFIPKITEGIRRLLKISKDRPKTSKITDDYVKTYEDYWWSSKDFRKLLIITQRSTKITDDHQKAYGDNRWLIKDFWRFPMITQRLSKTDGFRTLSKGSVMFLKDTSPQ